MDEIRILVNWLEGNGDLDVDAWRHRLVCGRVPAVPFGRRSSLGEQLEMLADGFAGECALVWLHAALNVALRRGLQPECNGRRFRALWDRHGDLLLELLDSRWLISACDSFADIHPDPAQAALAASASFLVNTVKLYETERGPAPAIPFPSAVAFREIFDGLTTFLPERGDMVANLVARLDACSGRRLPGSQASAVVPAILRELVSRLLRHDSVFQRARSHARFPWPVALPPLEHPLLEPLKAAAGAAAGSAAAGRPPGSEAPGWLLLNDCSHLARGFHLARLARAQALRDGLACRGLVSHGGVNDPAALPERLAAAAGDVRLLVLDASGLRPDGERARAFLAVCQHAHAAGLATAVIRAAPGWCHGPPFDRVFLTDPQGLAGLPAGTAAVEDPALALFAGLFPPPVPPPRPESPSLAVVDSPDPALAASLQRFAQAVDAPFLTLETSALARLRGTERTAGVVSGRSWPRLLRAPLAASADHWLADREGALLLLLSAGRSISVPAAASAGAQRLLRRFGLLEAALLPADWALADPARQERLVRDQAERWHGGVTRRVEAECHRACEGITAMLDNLAELALAPCGRKEGG
jgi:hypothetical protein